MKTQLIAYKDRNLVIDCDIKEYFDNSKHIERFAQSVAQEILNDLYYDIYWVESISNHEDHSAETLRERVASVWLDDDDASICFEYGECHKGIADDILAALESKHGKVEVK